MKQAIAPLALSCASVSCLISPPDPLEEKQQVAPYVVPNTITPSPLSYVESGRPFRVEFFSEDLNEKIVGKLYTNLDTARVRDLDSAPADAGSLSDPEPRVMELVWQDSASVAPGCYVVTMTITHASNYTDVKPPMPIDPKKTAYVSWWVVHKMAPEDLTFDQCPAPAPDLSTAPPGL
jgi:hypothetical protein